MAERQVREFVELYEQYAEVLESLFDAKRAQTASDRLRRLAEKFRQWEQRMQGLQLDPNEHRAAADKYKPRIEQAVVRVLAASQRLGRGEAKVRPNSTEWRSTLQSVDEITEIIGRIAAKFPL